MKIFSPAGKIGKRRALEFIGALIVVACATLAFRPVTPETQATPSAQGGGSFFSRMVPDHQRLLALNASEAERLTDLLATEPDNLEYLFRRSLVSGVLDRKEDELSDLDHIVALNPHASSTVFKNRAQVLAELGRFKEALPDAEQADRMFGVDFETSGTLGYVYAGLGRDQEAVEEYDIALIVRPDKLEYLSGRGAVLRRLGRQDEAQADFDRAKRLDPDFKLEWAATVPQ